MMVEYAVSGDDGNIPEKIMALEKHALEKWNRGEPAGYLEISAPDVTYFDPFLEKRLSGIESLSEYYRPIRGKIRVDAYEMIDPLVQVSGGMAVLSFNLVSHAGKAVTKWNCTEVYRLEGGGSWKIVQTHWSFVKPEQK